MKTQIGINGACGRMGQRLVVLANDDPALAVAAALDSPDHPNQGRDIGNLTGTGVSGVSVSAEVPVTARIDVMVDFSSPQGTMNVLKTCVARRIPIVVATTGHTAAQRDEIEAAAHQTAVLVGANMSLSVNVLFKLVREAAAALKDKSFDVEIIERHHRFKKDSPSGTAIRFAEIIKDAMGQTGLRHGREGLVGERPGSEIGIHAIRGGDYVGEHTIIFATMGETLELVHRGTSRDSYASGALQAAKFLAGKPAGRYTMDDVLGL